MRQLIVGNWKMNGLREHLVRLTEIERDLPENVDAAICVPATLLHAAASERSTLSIGAQDCHSEQSGAHTGDIAATMISDAGARYVIVGHSERRTNHGETSEGVAAKARAAHDAELISIICIGETEAERDSGETLDVLTRQLRASVPDCATAQNTVVAYEPVWAIGTGRSASPTDVRDAHAHIREVLADAMDGGSDVRLLYGGSVKPDNAAELLALDAVDGALVGGASLKAPDFLAICRATRD